MTAADGSANRDRGTASIAGEQPPRQRGVNLELRAQWRHWTRVYVAVYFFLALYGCFLAYAAIHGALQGRSVEVKHGVALLVAMFCWAGAWWSVERFARLVVRWDCHACGKRVSTESAWICGRCDAENRYCRYSVLSTCRHCGAQPSGYACPHCTEPTWFWPDPDMRHPARRVPDPRPGETMEQARARREQEIAEKRHEIERLKHEAEIRNLTSQAERLRHPRAHEGDALMEEQLERALTRLKVGMRAVARSKQLQAQVDQEIIANAPGLPAEDVERLRDYAKRQFEGYREDIALGRYDQ